LVDTAQIALFRAGLLFEVEQGGTSAFVGVAGIF
jgi:hypothetical protein